MVAGSRKLLAAAEKKRIVGNVHYALDVEHVLVVEAFPCRSVCKEQLGFAMRNKMMDSVGLEVVQDRDCHGAVGERSQGSHGPLGTVAPAKCDLVARLKAGMLECKVEFCYLTGYILIGEHNAMIIAQGRKIPVVADTLFDISGKGILCFHRVVLLYRCKFN